MLMQMGRASRRKRERRIQQFSRTELLAASEADRRGGGVEATPSAFAQAIAERGVNAMAEALVARHNLRWTNVDRAQAGSAALALALLDKVPLLDLTAYALGARTDRHPSDHQGGWLDRLGWGIDGVAGATRMLLAGNAVGGAAMLRVQLERWTANRAHALDESQRDGEPYESFVERIWSLPPRPLDGKAIADAWETMSEMLHGRGDPQVFAWEAVSLAVGPSGFAALPFIRAADAVTTQVSECYADMAHRRGHRRLANAALVRPAVDRLMPLIEGGISNLLVPMSFPVVTARFSVPDQWARRYRAGLGRFATTGEPGDLRFGPHVAPFFAFVERRSRLAAWCRRGFEQEAQMFGHEFNPYATPETPVTLACEMAALTGSWLRQDCAHPLVVASSALRAALWLWFDDDDRSMTLCRTVLEAMAKGRMLRIDPAAAADPSNERRLPSWWIRKAGWSELSVLGGALSELSHVSARSRWSGAKDAIRGHASDHANPALVSRRRVLEGLAGLLAEELAEELRAIDPAVASAWQEIAERGGLLAEVDALRRAAPAGPIHFGAFDGDSSETEDEHWYLEGLGAARSRMRWRE